MLGNGFDGSFGFLDSFPLLVFRLRAREPLSRDPEKVRVVFNTGCSRRYVKIVDGKVKLDASWDKVIAGVTSI